VKKEEKLALLRQKIASYQEEKEIIFTSSSPIHLFYNIIIELVAALITGAIFGQILHHLFGFSYHITLTISVILSFIASLIIIWKKYFNHA
jgi:F0F1-type ATP synthase assembly protein I